jgi:hypothetical protein
MGPVLVVGSASGTITGLDPSTGGTSWSRSSSIGLFSGPVVGGSTGSPVVYYGLDDPTYNNKSVLSAAATSGAAGVSCNAAGVPTLPSGCTVGPFNQSRNAQFLALASDGTALVIEDDEVDGNTSTGKTCGTEGYAGTRLGATCTGWMADTPGVTGTSLNYLVSSVTGLAIGRFGQAFFADRGLPAEIAVSGGGITKNAGAACTGPLITTDNSANWPVCSGQRDSFNGSSFSTSWATTFSAPLNAIGLVVANISGNSQPLALSNGAVVGSPLGANFAWAIDASNPPIVYLSSGGTLATLRLTASGFGTNAWGLPAVPGSVTDMVMDKNGVLYVSSNGQVSAIATDSPGLGTGGLGWPIGGHDACRSFNLEYSCPW